MDELADNIANFSVHFEYCLLAADGYADVYGGRKYLAEDIVMVPGNIMLLAISGIAMNISSAAHNQSRVIHYRLL